MTQPHDGVGRLDPARLGQDDTSTAEQAKRQAAGVADTASTQAAGVAEDAKTQAARVADQAKGEARDVAQHATREARGLLGQAQGELSTQAGSQQQRLAGLMRSLSEELGGILDPHNTDYRQGMVTDLARQASGRLDSATSWLENREPQDVLNEVSRFARRRPGTFLAIAAAAGLVVGRLSRGMADDARADSDQPQLGQQGARYADSSYGAAGYVPPASTATYGTTTYPGEARRQVYQGEAYGVPVEVPVADDTGVGTAYDEVSGLPRGDEPGADLAGRRLPGTVEAEQTFTPEVGTTRGEERR